MIDLEIGRSHDLAIDLMIYLVIWPCVREIVTSRPQEDHDVVTA
jgi:hypothetical protein